MKPVTHVTPAPISTLRAREGNNQNERHMRHQPWHGDQAAGRREVRMLPKVNNGSLHIEFKKCGTKTCRCARGLLHGPYFSYFFRIGGRLKKAYVPLHNLPRVLAEVQERQQRRTELRRLSLEVKELLNDLRS